MNSEAIAQTSGKGEKERLQRLAYYEDDSGVGFWLLYGKFSPYLCVYLAVALTFSS